MGSVFVCRLCGTTFAAKGELHAHATLCGGLQRLYSKHNALQHAAGSSGSAPHHKFEEGNGEGEGGVTDGGGRSRGRGGGYAGAKYAKWSGFERMGFALAFTGGQGPAGDSRVLYCRMCSLAVECVLLLQVIVEFLWHTSRPVLIYE